MILFAIFFGLRRLPLHLRAAPKKEMFIPQPKFLLRKPKDIKPTAIQCHLRFNGDRIVFSTGEKINPAEWDFSKQRAINSKKYPHNTELNMWLEKIDNEIKFIFRNFNLENTTPNRDLVLKSIHEKLFQKSSKSIPTLIEFIERYIDESAKIKNPDTVRTYVTTFKHLKSYAASQSIHLDYTSIDLDFYNSFVNYLMHDLSLSQNTIGKHIQVFKTFMNEATDRGYNKKMDFRGRKFKRLSEPVESIYLNEKELDVIRKLDLHEKPNLERVRDLFIIGCFTGLRYSDFIRIKPENIVNEDDAYYINILTQKTSQKVIIPLKPIVLEILNKYEGKIPKPLTNQKMNKYLKVMGELAGINQLIPITKTKAGKQSTTLVPKYNLIKTHTCRKSFATNAFRAGLPTLSIMKITGHKTETQFYRYVRISELENASSLTKHEFFKD